jgi:hypothetical protein
MVAPVIEDLALVPADGGFVQRAKALACTAPLHDLDARKSQLQGGEFNRYQMSELALHAIDLVTLAMDFDRGASHEQVVADLVPLAAMQAPDQPPSEHKQVAPLGPEQPHQRRECRPRFPGGVRRGQRAGDIPAPLVRLQAPGRAGLRGW